MIRIVNNMNADGTEHLQFYLNERTVGLYGENKRKADVQLIQVFLKNIYAHRTFAPYFKTLPKTRTNLGHIKIDGIAGSQTNSAIALFQKAAGSKFIQTGRVDVVLNPVSIENPDFTPNYTETILALNSYFFGLMGIKAAQNFKLKNLPDVKENAPELLAELERLETN